MSNTQSPEANLHAEERFRLLVNSVEDYAIFMLEPDGRVASWNAGAKRIKGYSRDEIIGQHFSRFYTEPDKAAGLPEWEIEQATKNGRVAVEGWRLRKDGSRFWAYVVITAVRDETGRLVGFAKVTRDLTDRREADEKLRTSEEQFRMLVDGVEEYAIYMLDIDGRVATWNSGAEKIKQYAPEEIIGRNFECFYTPADIAAGKPQHNLAEAVAKGHVRDQGLRVRKDGTIFEADVVITALRDPNGKLRGFSKVTRDITDQVRNRELEAAKLAAERSSKAKDDFLAALSHELRTPLTPALSAATFLAENAGKFPAEFGEELAIIRRNILLEARLIDDLLDLTRISRGKIELRRERVDAHTSVNDAIEIAKPAMEEKRLVVVTTLAAEKHHIDADPVRIRQVFWNLINNAVKFTGEAGRVTISTSNDDTGHFVFEITDTGIGIEPERQHALFAAFEQGERSITQQFGGLGLGLAISKNLVDLHGGSISAESRGKDHGALFRVTLPLSQAASSVSSDKTSTAGSESKRLRILVVEDHGDTRRALSRLLTHFGHDILVADCVEAALNASEAKNFDALLSDISLPDGTGYEIVAYVKKQQPLTAIALTGFGMDQDVQRSRDAGFDFHLTKPIDFAELRTLLGQVGV
jgi:PAS domain S-box-containing protein